MKTEAEITAIIANNAADKAVEILNIKEYGDYANTPNGDAVMMAKDAEGNSYNVYFEALEDVDPDLVASWEDEFSTIPYKVELVEMA